MTEESSPTQDVWAAGGLVWRRDSTGGLQMLLVHRPRYDDWTLPKGKQDPAEQLPATALREVAEETGLDVALDRPLGTVSYPLHHQQAATVTKRVRYWSMPLIGGEFTANPEVDEVRWLAPDAVRPLLTHDHDHQVLEEFLVHPVQCATVLLVRHARAGRRVEWDGPDRTRPLDETGRAQAEALAPLLACWPVQRIASAPPERCLATVRPLAQQLRLEVTVDEQLAESAWSADPDAARRALVRLASEGDASVVCSQGGVIASTVSALLGERAPEQLSARKGSAWALSILGENVLAWDYYDLS